MAVKSFQQLFGEKKGIVWAPCVYDCMSAKVAETIGFEAVTISSLEQRNAFLGFPSMTMDEMYTSSVNIVRSTNCAVLVDGEDGGGTPMEVYKNVKRFAEAGAMAISIEDMYGERSLGVRNIGVRNTHKSAVLGERIIPAEIWAANIQAAVEACKGTDCMVIARVDSTTTIGRGPAKMAGRPGISFDQAIRRAQLGAEMGAPMTMIQNICYRGGNEEWKRICEEVPGYHCYPDIHADNGQSDIEDVSELYRMGFQMITCHCFQKAAWKGMMEYGRWVFEHQNTILPENDDFGYPIFQITPQTYPEMAEKCDRWVDTIERFKGYE